MGVTSKLDFEGGGSLLKSVIILDHKKFWVILSNITEEKTPMSISYLVVFVFCDEIYFNTHHNCH